MWLCHGTPVIFRHTRRPEKLNWDIVVQQLGFSSKMKATQKRQYTAIRLNDPHIPKHVSSFWKILLAASHTPR
jgi:hypothetical protein